MFKPMRRIEKQMEEKDALDILKRGDYGVLSLMQNNGYPYGLPLNYAYKDGFIYFHGAKTGNKLDSILENYKACFSVVEYYKLKADKFDTEYNSVLAFGRCEILEGEEKIQGLKILLEKYSREFLEAGMKYIEAAVNKTAVFKMKIDHVTGKKGR